MHEERVVTHLQKIMSWSDEFVRMTDEDFQTIHTEWQRELNA